MDQVVTQLLGALPSVLSGGGFTGGLVLTIFGRLIAAEKLWFNRSVQRVLDEKDKQLADIREQTNLRIVEKDGELTRMKDELGRMTADRDFWRTASDGHQRRADVATDRLANEAIPVLRALNHTFGQFTEAAATTPEPAS